MAASHIAGRGNAEAAFQALKFPASAKLFERVSGEEAFGIRKVRRRAGDVPLGTQ